MSCPGVSVNRLKIISRSEVFLLRHAPVTASRWSFFLTAAEGGLSGAVIKTFMEVDIKKLFRSSKLIKASEIGTQAPRKNNKYSRRKLKKLPQASDCLELFLIFVNFNQGEGVVS